MHASRLLRVQRCTSTPPRRIPATARLGARSTTRYTTITGALDAAKTIAVVPDADKTFGNVTIHVFAGTYTQERFPLLVKSGVNLEGESRDATIVMGNGQYNPPNQAASSSGSYATIVIGDGLDSNAVSHLTIRPASPLMGYPIGIICDTGNTGPVGTPTPLPNSQITDVTIAPDFGAGIVASTNAAGGCNLSLTGSIVQGKYQGIWAIGCSDPNAI